MTGRTVEFVFMWQSVDVHKAQTRLFLLGQEQAWGCIFKAIGCPGAVCGS